MVGNTGALADFPLLGRQETIAVCFFGTLFKKKYLSYPVNDIMPALISNLISVWICTDFGTPPKKRKQVRFVS
jgi:hypothetical protein